MVESIFQLTLLYYYHQFEEVVVLNVTEELAKGERTFLFRFIFEMTINNTNAKSNNSHFRMGKHNPY